MKQFVNRNPRSFERVGEPFQTASRALAMACGATQTYLEKTDGKPLRVAQKDGEGLFVVFTDAHGNPDACAITEQGDYL